MAPKMEPPVCEPKGLVLPKGLGAKGLSLALLVWLIAGCDQNGLLDDCPKAVERPQNLACASIKLELK